jgi:ATP-dependent phosphofructokinase / diphosphate-dependent phosphofructokinase
MTKRIGVLTGGGDAPGQNACLKAIVQNAIDRGFDVIGIRQGWTGLLRYDPDNADTHSGQIILLNKSRVRDIDRQPGSFLHASRLNPAAVAPQAVPYFLESYLRGDQPIDVTPHIIRAIEKIGLSALVVVGDSGTLKYAARLSEAGVPVVGIPKTVHNTVSGSDYALGFSTALGRGVHFVHEIRAMAGSREEIAVVEILGRDSGLTTLLISLLAGVDRTLIPEAPIDPEKLAALLLHDKQTNPNNYAILTMSEAVQVVPEKVRKYLPELSRLASARTLSAALDSGNRTDLERHLLSDRAARREVGAAVGGSGTAITEILENLTGQRLLLQPLSYLIRTGEPDGQDLLSAVNFAMLAVNCLSEGTTGRLIAYRQGENYIDVPIEAVTQPLITIDLDKFYDAKSYNVKPGALWATRV